MDDTSVRDVIALFREHQEAHIGLRSVRIGKTTIPSDRLVSVVWRLIADVDDMARLIDMIHNQLAPLVPDDLKSFDDDYIETRANLITNPDDWRGFMRNK